MTTDVIIVGAGPTGLSLAVFLAQQGVSCLIFDKELGITHLSKALGIQARTLELFDDTSIVEPFLDRGYVASTGHIFVGGKTKAQFDMSKIGEGLSPYPYMLTLPQHQTEHILEAQLKDLGEQVLWQTELLVMSQDQNGVHVELRMAGEHTERVTGRYLVGCDGAGSTVRKQLGLRFEGDTLGKYFYVVDAQIDWSLGYGEDFYHCFCRNTFVAFIPIPGEQRFRIIGTLPPRYEQPGQITLEQICTLIQADSEIPLIFREISWHPIYKVHTRKADRFRRGRCFVAGDAAHVHTPAGGQGMNTGIQDSYNLAWKLAAVLHGKATDALLTTYDTEREANATALLAGTDRAFELQAGDSPVCAFLRLHVLPPLAERLLRFSAFRRRLFRLFSQIDIRYPDSPLTVNGKAGKVAAEDRLPYFHLADGRSGYDLVRSPAYHLLATSDTSDYAVPAHVVHRHVSAWPAFFFGDNTEELLLLVRPDNYLAYVGTDRAAVERYFERACFAEASPATYQRITT